MAKDLIFDLSPTQAGFVNTDAHVAMLMGPMGEGKTHAGIAGVVRHAKRCKRDIRGALVRDTHQNIKTSTVSSIQEILGGWVHFHDDFKKMVIESRPRVEMDLFGIDDPASLAKLQGPEYAIVWLEEPAPIKEKANAGLPKEVFDLSLARSARQPGTTPRVQVTQNPGDENHWTEKLAQAPRLYMVDAETGLAIIKEVFRIPYGENRYANPLMRVANKAAFQSDPGKYARYVEGRAAAVSNGIPVTQDYNPRIHYSYDIELPVIDGALGVRCYDGWHHPAIIVCQYAHPGQLIVHDVMDAEGADIMALVEGPLRTLLSSPKYLDAEGRDLILDWRDAGDPSMMQPDQSTRNRVTGLMVADALKSRFEKGPKSTAILHSCLKMALRKILPNGAPQIYLSKSAYPLHRALNGGWHWAVDNNGNPVGTQPVKDRWSHIGEAFGYGVGVVFPMQREKKKDTRKTAMRARQAKAMANSYASGNFRTPGFTRQIGGIL